MKTQNKQTREYKTITISHGNWRKIHEIKMDNHFVSLDEVISYLLNKKRQKEVKNDTRK